MKHSFSIQSRLFGTPLVIISLVVVAIALAFPATRVSAVGDPCVLPGLEILTDPAGDIITPTGQDSNRGWDLRSLSIAEPSSFAPDKLIFTLKVQNLGVLPANTRWPIQFRVPGDAATLGRWVDMRSDPTQPTGVGFKYGTFVINATTGAYSAPAAVVGDADAASTYNTDGTITIVVPRSNIGNPAVGENLTGFLMRVRFGADLAAVTPDNMPNDLVPAGSYTVMGNDGPCPPPTDCPPPPFIDDFEPAAEPGWEVDTDINLGVPASQPWTESVDATANSPTHSYKTDASTTDEKDDRLIAPAQNLSPTSHLIFWHKFVTEDGFDGGVLEVSTNGGDTWVDVGTGAFISGGYNGVIVPDFDSRIADRDAWTGFSEFVDGMNMVEVNLGAFAGLNRLIRWRFVADPFTPGAAPGESWAIDDVQFTNLACDIPTPTLVVSRKIHGGGPFFDVILPLTGNPGIECRSGGVTQVVFMFPAAVTFTGASMTGTGMVTTTSGSGTNEATINLTGVTNLQTITVTLEGVSAGGAPTDISVSIGVLLGDTTSSRSVNSSDIGQTKSKSGQTADGINFRTDVTVSGSINSSDIGLVKSKSGTSLPP